VAGSIATVGAAAGDVYSYGILLYEMTTGEQAWAGLHLGEVMEKVGPGGVALGRCGVSLMSRTQQLTMACPTLAALRSTLPRRLVLPGPAGPDAACCAAPQVAMAGERPFFPAGTLHEVVELAEACWAHCPEERPTFEAILMRLQSLLAAMGIRWERVMEGGGLWGRQGWGGVLFAARAGACSMCSTQGAGWLPLLLQRGCGPLVMWIARVAGRCREDEDRSWLGGLGHPGAAGVGSMDEP